MSIDFKGSHYPKAVILESTPKRGAVVFFDCRWQGYRMPETPKILQLKIRLLGISPMIWRRLLVPSSTSLHELHGIIQVAMGWESIHLFQFNIRAVDYGSWELHSANPDIPLRDFDFPRNDRFSYIYDVGDYWKHDIRVEAFPDKNPKKVDPVCTGGSGICPPEDCGGPDGFLTRRDEGDGYDAWCDLDILSGFAADLLECRDTGKDMADLDMSDVQFAVDRINAREPFIAGKFSRKQVNGLVTV